MEIWKDLGIVTIVSGVIVYLARQIINLGANTKLEHYKNELHKETEDYKLNLTKEVEKYKSELSILSNRKFKLDETRALVIAELYKNISIFYQDLMDLTSLFKQGIDAEDIEKKDQEKMMKTANSGNDFYNYYSSSKIYFTGETCNVIQKFIEETKKAFYDYIFPMRFPGSTSPSILGKRNSASKKVRDEIPKLLKAIEEEFRALTGVN